jgi:protein-S-isoprenylcysteine O-methyltransferase Ste14
MTTTSARARRISDWIGFIVFGAWAIVTFSKMPAVGIFVAPTIIFELLVALSFLIRDQPLAANRSLRARLSAYGGTFFILIFLQLANRYYPAWFASSVNTRTLIGATLLIGGTMWTAYAVWHLRFAFSIEPAARRLITSGPYKVARHPIYTGYVAQYGGMLLTFPTAPFALALLVWALLVADRMRLEESVLSRAFPEYSDYRSRVGALFTMPSRRAPRPEAAAPAR